MKTNNARLATLAVAALSAAIPVAAQAPAVSYTVFIRSAKLVVKIDTFAMASDGRIEKATLWLILKDSQGRTIGGEFVYSITQRTGALVPKQIYEVRSSISETRARSVQVTRAAKWAEIAGGGKADGLEMQKATIVREGGVLVLPAAPSAGREQGCGDYARSATAQNRQNRARQCGFRGNRWSGTFAHHYNWCLGIAKASINAETRARQTALASCPKP